MIESKDFKEFPIVKKYYSCYDKTGQTYLGVFEADTDMRALRMVEDSLEEPKSMIAKHPEDFVLYRLFEVNMRTGEIIANDIVKLMEINDMKENKNVKTENK